MTKPIITLILCLCLCVGKLKAQETKWLFKTNLFTWLIKSEANLFVEKIDLNKHRGAEIGLAYHHNQSIAFAVTSMGLYGMTTDGGNYGLEKTLRNYQYTHNGFSTLFNYKFYNKKNSFFFGPQAVFTFRKHINQKYYSDPPRGNFGSYYFYVANHFNTRLGLLFNVGKMSKVTKHKLMFEYGLHGGVGLNYDKLDITSYGHSRNTTPLDPNFVALIKSNTITKNTNGFYMTPMFNVYLRFGIAK